MAAAVASPSAQTPVPTPRRDINHADPLDGLHTLAAQPPLDEESAGGWRWSVVKHLGVVRDLLAREPNDGGATLMARHECVRREQAALLHRLAPLTPLVLEARDLTAVAGEIERFLRDVTRHVQRRHDLAYDEVSQELGGSE